MARPVVNVPFTREACCSSAIQHPFYFAIGGPAGWPSATSFKKALRKVARGAALRIPATPSCMAISERESNVQPERRVQTAGSVPEVVWTKLLKQNEEPCPETVWNLLLEAVPSKGSDSRLLDGAEARGTSEVVIGQAGTSGEGMEVQGESKARDSNGAGSRLEEKKNGAAVVNAERMEIGTPVKVEDTAVDKDDDVASSGSSEVVVAISQPGEGKKRGLSNLMANLTSGVKESAVKQEAEAAPAVEKTEESLQAATPRVKSIGPSRVKKIQSQAELDDAVKSAGSQLLVLFFASKDDKACKQMFSTISSFSRLYEDVNFLVVIGDESDATREFCHSVDVVQGPHFMFFYRGKKIRDSNRVGEDELYSSIIYYSKSIVTPLINTIDRRERLDELRSATRDTDKLLVISVCLHECWPCVRIYGTFNNLSKQMKDIAIFARLIGDANESTLSMLKEFEILEVPTFLFVRKGEIVGRYVGSGKGDLIGEILRHQGVKSHIR